MKCEGNEGHLSDENGWGRRKVKPWTTQSQVHNSSDAKSSLSRSIYTNQRKKHSLKKKVVEWRERARDKALVEKMYAGKQTSNQTRVKKDKKTY